MSSPVLETVSSGGIVLRGLSDEEILVGKRTRNVENKWAPTLVQLPKGGVRPTESLEDAALREVTEETGFRTRIVCKAGTASWRYQRGGCSYTETVHYFFMDLLDPTPGARDEEFDEAIWIAINQAAQMLSYPEEKHLIARILTSGDFPIRRSE